MAGFMISRPSNKGGFYTRCGASSQGDTAQSRAESGSATESLGPEQAIPGVTETRKDVAMIVQPLVEGGREDRHVGVRVSERLHAFGAGHEANELQARGLRFLETGDRRDS